MSNAYHLLLIEDEPADAELFRELLGEVDAQVVMHHAGHGAEALTHLRRGLNGETPLPDLILVDLNMPVMGGHEFLTQAKADPRLRAIPMLVLSTSDAKEDVERAMSSHANSYLVKPTHFASYLELLEAVRSYWWGVHRPALRAE